MTELMTRVLNSIPANEAVPAFWVSMQIGASVSGTIDALHKLQDADLVMLRNGFYRLSEAAKDARQSEATDQPLPDCVVQGDDEHWMVDR